MSYLVINGGKPLEGEVSVHGSKNAVLPILAATLLNRGINVIHNCPRLKDVEISLEILRHLGCTVTRDGDTVTVCSKNACGDHIPVELMRRMRSSIVFMGAILARMQSAVMSMPGGCEIGLRPIDLHLKAFRTLGVDVVEEQGEIRCRMQKIIPQTIQLELPSVGATENIMLLSCVADGVTVINNAAREPEIIDLQNYLNAIGACVTGAGTDTVKIRGVSRLHDGEHTIIPDRIVASTYLACAMTTGGTVTLNRVIPAHISAMIATLRECGAHIFLGRQSVTIRAPHTALPVRTIRTAPYPGFPTDAQSILLSVLAVSRGTSIIKENIFEGRFRHAFELNRMGADIEVEGRLAVVRGVRRLYGCSVMACDLRSGAALVAAGLGAHGTTTVGNVHYIDRGYEQLERELRTLGADIERVESL